MFTPYRGG